MRQIITTVRERIEDTQRLLDICVEHQLDRLSVRQLQIVTIAMIGVVMVLPVPVAAQMEEIGEAMCGYGIGDIVTMLFALVALGLIIKSAFQLMFAFDKLNSTREQDHYEGKQLMKSAVLTFFGAFVPLMFMGILDIVGVNTVSCLDLDIGLV